MARWKLLNSHYLNVPGEEWEYTENDRKTGRPKRVKFPVPRLLDPRDPTCWTNRWGGKDNEDGEIIVCHEGKGDANDQIFVGDPTPDMMPVDDEAIAISAGFTKHWAYKPETSSGDFSQSLIDKFQAEAAVPKPVEVPGMDALVAAMTMMAKTNQELISTLAPARRV